MRGLRATTACLLRHESMQAAVAVVLTILLVLVVLVVLVAAVTDLMAVTMATGPFLILVAVAVAVVTTPLSVATGPRALSSSDTR